jgi:hypothetical protein
MSEAERIPPPASSVRHSAREPLAAALRAAFREHGADIALLREAVCDHVDAARARGDPVERVIIDLKEEMRAAGVVDRYVRAEERALAESVIRWCIERYYGSARRLGGRGEVADFEADLPPVGPRAPPSRASRVSREIQ